MQVNFKLFISIRLSFRTEELEDDEEEEEEEEENKGPLLLINLY